MVLVSLLKEDPVHGASITLYSRSKKTKDKCVYNIIIKKPCETSSIGLDSTFSTLNTEKERGMETYFLLEKSYTVLTHIEAVDVWSSQVPGFVWQNRG